MIVCSATYQIETFVKHCLCKCFRIFDHLLLIFFEFRFQSFSETDGLCSNNMHQRSSLCSRENGFVDRFCVFLFTHDHTASRTSECLMRGRGYNICIWDRALVQSRCHKSCNVCHIYKQICPDLLCDIFKDIKPDLSWICRCACNDHLWFAFLCGLTDLIIIQISVVVHIVWYEMI